MKKNKLIALSFLMATVMLSSTVALAATSKETATANGYNAEYPTELTYVYKSNPETAQGDLLSTTGTTFILDGYSDNYRAAFMKIDFSSVNLNSYPGMQLKLTGFRTNNSQIGVKTVDLKISIVPDAIEDAVSFSSLSYNAANNAGWMTGGEEIGSISGTMPTTSNPAFYSTDILDAIKADVTANDGTVVLRIESNVNQNGNAATYYANWNDAHYKENAHITPMTQTAVTTGKANAQADADAIVITDTVTAGGTIVLPSEGTVTGSKITWKSDSEYIDASTGAVASNVGFADKVVTLTASVINNYEIIKKEFEVTVNGSMIQPVGDYVSIRAHGTGFANSNLNQKNYLIVNPQYANNRYQGILRFDLTDIKEIIGNLDDISLRLTFSFIKETTGADLTTGRYMLQILPDMAWTVDEMTFDYIYKYGADIENPNGTNMFAKAVTAGITGTVPTAKENTMVFGGLKAAIEKYIAENPNATTITFLLAGENPENLNIEDSVRFYVPEGTQDPSTDATAPVLIGETAKRFTARNNNGAVTFTYNVDLAKYPTGINMPATFFAAEYNSSGKLVNVAFEADADSKLTSGETKTLTINGFTSGNSVNAMIFNNLSEIMPMQSVTPLGN